MPSTYRPYLHRVQVRRCTCSLCKTFAFTFVVCFIEGLVKASSLSEIDTAKNVQDDYELSLKLIDKIKEKMNQSISVPSTMVKPPMIRLTAADRISESPEVSGNEPNLSGLSYTPSFTSQSRATVPSQLYPKTPTNQYNQMFLLHKPTSPTESTSTTAVLAMQPKTKTSIKGELHNMLEFYTGGVFSTHNLYKRNGKVLADTSMSSNVTDTSKNKKSLRNSIPSRRQSQAQSAANDKKTNVSFNLKK
jgi:hypothetical protein